MTTFILNQMEKFFARKLQGSEKMVGDAIHDLKVDPSDASKPQNPEEFANVMQNLQTLKGSTLTSSGMSTVRGFKVSAKRAAILTVIFVILCLPPVQNALGSVFKNSFVKLFIQALIFFLVATFLIKKC
jgi:hypothetical protein